VAKKAERHADGRVVVGFKDEWNSPRALGNRSILVDSRRAEMKDILNDRIKKRESFRPFAPSILEERVGDISEQSSSPDDADGLSDQRGS
jgi:carbamoyltransferase